MLRIEARTQGNGFLVDCSGSIELSLDNNKSYIFLLPSINQVLRAQHCHDVAFPQHHKFQYNADHRRGALSFMTRLNVPFILQQAHTEHWVWMTTLSALFQANEALAED